MVETNSQALIRSLQRIFESVAHGGKWGDYQESWDPVITAMVVDLLMNCGLTADSAWYVEGETISRHALSQSLEYLDSCIRDDGSFGTDFWDATRLALTTTKHGLSSSLPRFELLMARLINVTSNDEFINSESEWAGPGFVASALDLFRVAGHSDKMKHLQQKLLDLQNANGFWQGRTDIEGHPVISPVWHTAQSVLSLATVEEPAFISAVSNAANWLIQSQEADGCWPSVNQYRIYFTSYAAIALVSTQHGRPTVRKPIERAIDYLKARMDETGKCSDLGGTLMCAMALRAVVGDGFSDSLTIADCLLARNAIARANAAVRKMKQMNNVLQAKKAELRGLHAKYDGAEIVITKMHMLFLAIFGIVISAISIAVTFVFAKMLTKP